MWRSYLAMGDSATEGVGDDVPGIPCRSWADLVAEALQREIPGLVYRNIGRKGATAQVVLEQQVPVLREVRPDFVTLTVGANDARRPEWTLESLDAQLQAILEATREAGARPMMFAYPDILPVIQAAGHEIRDSWRPYFERMHAVNDAIRAVAARNGALLLDLECLETARDPRILSRDFTHPNALGYLLTAREALRILAPALGIPALAEAVAPIG